MAEFPGGFTNYGDPDNWREFAVDPPVCGRYVVVQKVGGEDRVLEIMELEVYSFLE